MFPSLKSMAIAVNCSLYYSRRNFLVCSDDSSLQFFETSRLSAMDLILDPSHRKKSHGVRSGEYGGTVD
uniref:Uncharacterized protein n=1 Tax=Ditylenchus dipsaci TaxID=166011 RepID=A0A915CR79_9BILA